ncbi:MAG: thiamine-phosphate kinase [Planctomycetes bacterium]|nr:thiamine-phosphate kinase [Planctomycetota bacterium]
MGRRKGEFALIEWIRRRAPRPRGVVIGIGDDAAAMDVRRDRLCLLSTDMMLEGTHFDLKRCTPRQVGRKAMATNLSDIAAMGCVPTVAVVSLGLPGRADMKFAKELNRGMHEMAAEFGVAIVGGDITSGKGPLAISVAILGRDAGLKPLRRSGAKVGDAIMVTGTLGGSILGKHLDFTPRVREALILNRRFKLHAMIDISDGLAADLNHICEESRVAATLYADRIPISDAARRLARKTGKTPLAHALSDGEDYELLFTLSQREARRLMARNPLGVPVSHIGRIHAGRGMWLADKHGKRARLAPMGYEHFK